MERIDEGTVKKYSKISPKQQLMLLESRKRNILISLFYILFGAMVAAVYLYFSYEESWSSKLKPVNYIIAAAIWIFISMFSIIYWNLLIEFRKTRCRRELIEEEIDNISNDDEEDLLKNSLQMSYKYLDQYYLQTREQAQKGFFVTITVSICGAIIIGIGIIAMFVGKGNAAYITTASGVITEFIAAVFFYLYNKTIQSMGAYHNKLVLSQNIAIALKISDSLSDDIKNEAKKNIIEELIKDINNHINSVGDLKK